MSAIYRLVHSSSSALDCAIDSTRYAEFLSDGGALRAGILKIPQRLVLKSKPTGYQPRHWLNSASHFATANRNPRYSHPQNVNKFRSPLRIGPQVVTVITIETFWSCAEVASSVLSALGTMYLSKKMLFILLCWISMIATTAANYCEWGYCAPSEYCCGDNQCCKDTKTTWMLIVGLLSALVVASVCCACFYRHIDYYRMRMQWPFFSSNELLITQTKA